jgi:hypothetical protein
MLFKEGISIGLRQIVVLATENLRSGGQYCSALNDVSNVNLWASEDQKGRQRRIGTTRSKLARQCSDKNDPGSRILYIENWSKLLKFAIDQNTRNTMSFGLFTRQQQCYT